MTIAAISRSRIRASSERIDFAEFCSDKWEESASSEGPLVALLLPLRRSCSWQRSAGKVLHRFVGRSRPVLGGRRMPPSGVLTLADPQVVSTACPDEAEVHGSMNARGRFFIEVDVFCFSGINLGTYHKVTVASRRRHGPRCPSQAERGSPSNCYAYSNGLSTCTGNVFLGRADPG